MSDPITELGKLLQDAGATVKFGLRAQGHLPTIERMLDEGASWHAIGRAIGWDKHAACEHYTIHLWEEAKAAQARWVAEFTELRAALKACEEATCANFDAVSAERDNLRTALATAQAEREAALQRAEQAEVTVALLRDFTTRERALRDAVGKGGQHVGYSPSINPTTLRELERMLTDAPSTANWLGEQVRKAEAALAKAQAELKAEQAEQEAVTAERNEAVQGLVDCHLLARRALAAATRDGMAKHLPHILRICERQTPEGTPLTSILRDETVAHPPALPSLPADWEIAAVLAQEETR